ncbi:hypothetical protein [Pseudomonas syringae]|nr:hypothetical protein [Pseudomonas syringae]
MTIDKKHPYGFPGASLAMGYRGITVSDGSLPPDLGGEPDMVVGDPRNPFRHPALADGYASGWNSRSAKVSQLQAEVARLKNRNNQLETDRQALEYLMGQFEVEVCVCDTCGDEKEMKDCDSAYYLRDYLGKPAQDEAPVEGAKMCAAKYGPHECSAARAEDSLFCAQHRSVDGRQRMGSEPITNEDLAFMMQRDGETQ